MNRYVKDIEKELAGMMQQKPKRIEGKGLLSPTKTTAADKPMSKSTRDFVLNLTADIRRKRLSMKETT